MVWIIASDCCVLVVPLLVVICIAINAQNDPIYLFWYLNQCWIKIIISSSFSIVLVHPADLRQQGANFLQFVTNIIPRLNCPPNLWADNMITLPSNCLHTQLLWGNLAVNIVQYLAKDEHIILDFLHSLNLWTGNNPLKLTRRKYFVYGSLR